MSVLNPSTFLDFVQRAAQDCRLANIPTSTLGQVGQAADFVNWTNETWKEIQNRRDDWWWMRASLSFTTVGGTTIYTPVANVSGYHKRSFRYYKTSTGLASELPLPYLEYDRWRDSYQLGSLRTTQTVPQVFTITPALSIGLNTPLVGYTVTGDYYRAMTQFETDNDVTDLPIPYRMLIVYGVMMKYGASKNSSELYTTGEKEYGKLMNKLEARQLPEVEGASALA